MLGFSGIDDKRLQASWISSAEAPELVHELKSFIDTIREIGPSPLGKKVMDAKAIDAKATDANVA